MLSNPQRLKYRRPSPTTIEFIVSTARARNTLASHVLFLVFLSFQIALGLSSILIVYVKWSFDKSSLLKLPLGEALLGSASGQIAAQIVQKTDWLILAPLLAIAVHIIFKRPYTEESLLVLRGLGVQTSTVASTYLFSSTTRFIPTRLIQDIFVHEAFSGFSVRFYLAIVVEGEEEVVVVFPNLLPKRAILEEVWRGARACLYEPKS